MGSVLPGNGRRSLMNFSQLRSNFARHLHWTPLIWPLIFLLLAREFAPRYPIHWNWDAFSYLDAMLQGASYVPLGLGRTPFCWFNNFIAMLAGWSGSTDPFSYFRLQVRVTTIVQTLALGLMGVAIARRVGVLAAHGALAVMILNTDFLLAHGAIWPENLSNVFLLVTIFVLLLRTLPVWWRLALASVSCSLMVLMKETGITYVPALFLLSITVDPALAGRRWKPLAIRAFLFGLIGGVLPLALFHLFTWMVPGLGDARAALIRDHFSMENTGIVYMGENLAALTGRFILATWLFLPLLVLLPGAAWNPVEEGIFRIHRISRRCTRWPGAAAGADAVCCRNGAS